MIHLQIDQEYQDQVQADRLEQAALAVIAHQGLSGGVALTLVITNEEQIQTLNREYRDTDAPTDVLSFEAGDTDPESGLLYLGDVIIAYPIAKSQAKHAGHSLMDEIVLLVVHGILHLLKYDHYKAEDQAAMWAAQDEILSHLGVSARPTT